MFVGLDHYGRLLHDQVFIDALLNTILLGVAFLVIVLPLSLVLASLLNGIRHCSTPFKVIYFLPQMTSAVAIALIFNYIFQPDWGLLNGILRSVGVEHTPLWLAEPRLDAHRVARRRDHPRGVDGPGLLRASSSWPASRPSRASCTTRPPWTEPARSRAGGTSRCRACGRSSSSSS